MDNNNNTIVSNILEVYKITLQTIRDAFIDTFINVPAEQRIQNFIDTAVFTVKDIPYRYMRRRTEQFKREIIEKAKEEVLRRGEKK